jgi:copper chaperone CopZ
VPLGCNAVPELGCGSRIKPLFIESAKQKDIKESWVNHEGTVIAFIWADDKPNNDLAEQLFKQFEIDASLINDKKRISDLTADLKGKGKWYNEFGVDNLSIEEAGYISKAIVNSLVSNNIIKEEQAKSMMEDLDSYFKSELIKVRTKEELYSESTHQQWQSKIIEIGEKYTGKGKMPKVQLRTGKNERFNRQSKSDVNVKTEMVSLNISGMTCGGCEATVKMSAKKVDGVIDCNADYKTGKAEVKFNPDKVSVEQIAKAITDAGYKAEKAEKE